MKRFLSLALILLAPVAVRAAESSPKAEITATAPSGSSSVLKRFTATSAIEVYGPSITEWRDLRPNVDKGTTEDIKSPVYSKNKFNLGYKLTSTRTTGLGLEFYSLSRVGNVFKDPYVYVRDNKLIEAGNYTMDLALRVYAGVSPNSRAANTLPTSAFRLVHNSTYKFDSSSWSAAFYSETQWNPQRVRKVGAYEVGFFLVPNVNYNLSDSFALNLGTKIWTTHKVGQTFFAQTIDPILVSPNVAWKPISGLTVNPYLDFAPGQAFAMKFTTIGLNLSYKLI